MSETLVSSRSALDIARRAAFRPIVLSVSVFAVVSAGMLVALIVATAAGNRIDAAVWVRCSIVSASSVLLLAFAARAARGSRSAWARLRIIAPVMFVAIVVIVSIPGFMPGWVRIEQAVCGMVLLPAAVLANLPRTRTLFAAKA